MSDEQHKSGEERAPDHQENPLLVSEVVRFLSRLASLHADPKTGNQALSNGLQQLAEALKPHAHLPMQGFAELLSKILPSDQRKVVSKENKPTLPPDLESQSAEEIDKILADENFTKAQLIELGFRRLGISKSKLTRLSKTDALESIRAALDHERSLNVISQEARRGGEKRSS